MSFGIFCTFDLKNASSKDYDNAYADLERIGLKRVVEGTLSDVVIPTTSTTGKFTGSSIKAVRDDILMKVQNAFKARGFKSEIFLFIGEETNWTSSTT